MDVTGWAVLAGAVAGAAISGLTSIILEWRRGSNESRLDKERRADDRRIEVDRIQRQNLLELQEWLAKFVRASGKEWIADKATLKGRGDLFLLPEGVSEEIFETQRELGYRIERVRDDGLRADLEGFVTASTAASVGKLRDREGLTVAELDRRNLALMERYEPVRRRMGEVLRTYL